MSGDGAALAYARHGWPVFPLHNPEVGGCSCGRPCKDIGKHPRTLHGVLDASTDTAVIQRWWRMWPEANVGLATGAASGIIVLDVDDMESLRHLETIHGALPETASVSTGKGQHFYFTHPGGVVRNSNGDIAPGIDIRGHNGYAVAPPSRHANGAQYRWISPKGVGPAPCPQWLVEALTSPTSPAPSTGHQGVIANGMRNSTLFRLGCAMRHWGASPAAVRAALQADNAERCDPPLDEREVARIAESVMRYQPGVPDGDAKPHSQPLRPWRTIRV